MSGALQGKLRGLAIRLNRYLQTWVRLILFEMRRTRQVIVAPEARVSDEPPVFLVGVHRSGTTLLRLIIDAHSRMACPPESFFVSPLRGVLDDSQSKQGLEAMGFDEDHVRGRLREFVSYFFETYAAGHQKQRWADKTPSYVDDLDFLDSLFGPECRYVMIYRHGLDAACSIAGIPIREVDPHIEACGDRFAGAARYWAVQCQKMLDFQAKHPGRCLEIRYEELTRDPEPHLRRLCEFLDEPWEDQLLRFYEKPHDHWIGLQDSKAADSRGFEPKIGAWRRQPLEVIEKMLREAAPMLEKLGYSVRTDEEG